MVGADPFVLAHGGRYYLYSTNADDGFRVFASEDMAQWTDMGYCLKRGDVIGEKWFWAPEILEKDSVSLKKLTEMKKRLESGYTSFWS